MARDGTTADPQPSMQGTQWRGHTLIATIATATTQDVVAALANVPGDVDLVEIRLDHLWPTTPDGERATDDLLAIVDAGQRPLLATLRPQRQGGKFVGPEQVRLGLLQAALQAGFTHADAELDVLAVHGVATTLLQHGDVVASRHEFGEMPCRSDGLLWLQQMQDVRPNLQKLALTSSSFADAMRALEFTRAHAERGGHPAIATMGHGGALLRALLPLAGNRATYASAPKLASAAPGQPTLESVQGVWRHWGLTAADLDHMAAKPQPWLAVLGIPIEHSLSPALHNAALRADGRNERFGALEVPASASALRLAFHVAPRIGMVGASVTAPHKLDAARSSAGDATVQAIGAANCVRFGKDSQPQSTNTDASALQRLAEPLLASGDAALVLGAGGAARAAIHALLQLGAEVTVASRDPAKGQAAAGDKASWLAWDQREVSAKLVVNATTLGRQGGDANPVAEATLAKRPAVIDLVYAAGKTALQRDAESAGCTVIDGTTFLLEQAVDAYRFWFGAAPQRTAMQRALKVVP